MPEESNTPTMPVASGTPSTTPPPASEGDRPTRPPETRRARMVRNHLEQVHRDGLTPVPMAPHHRKPRGKPTDEQRTQAQRRRRRRGR